MTEFQRNTRTHLERLKKTGQPEVLTVNGQAEVVVQDAVAYQSLVDKLESIEGIRKGLESMARGEGRSVEAFFDEFERKHAIQPGSNTLSLSFQMLSRKSRMPIYTSKKIHQ